MEASVVRRVIAVTEPVAFIQVHIIDADMIITVETGENRQKPVAKYDDYPDVTRSSSSC